MTLKIGRGVFCRLCYMYASEKNKIVDILVTVVMLVYLWSTVSLFHHDGQHETIIKIYMNLLKLFK